MSLRAAAPSPLLCSSSLPLFNPLSTSIPSSLVFKTQTIPSLRRARTHLYRFLSLKKPSPFSPLFSFPNHQEFDRHALPSSSPIFKISPFLRSEWKPILKGWICSAVSVYCLSNAVPRVGRLPTAMAPGIGADRMVREGLALAALAGARSVTGYLQQAFLWEAALNSVYEIRVHVFDRLLQRDIGFFEGNAGAPSGDIAYRITAEGSDVADTVYALLNTVIPNTLQLIAMAVQMMVVSPPLSIIAVLAIPCLSLIIAYLGRRLREISRNAHLSVARLSAYLNEFHVPDNMPPVLNGLNLHIKPGERVALVGPSGGGKTTLTKLLLRLYDPQSGCILVDNHDIQDIRLRSLREHIALVSQDIMLFSGTVAENIGFRDSIGKVNMEQVEYAARISKADEFIATLSNGYETIIGQRGSLLSGGQKQRLAIARALYQKSSVLILDEATSALDSKSELLVRQALEHMMAKHTVLIIAHRLETILMADRVLVLDGGKLEEVSKSSILAQDGQCALPALNKVIV